VRPPRIPGRFAAWDRVEVRLNCSSRSLDGKLKDDGGKAQPSRFGRPRDIPIVGYGGRTINHFAWVAGCAGLVRLSGIRQAISLAPGGEMAAELDERRAYPDDSTSRGQALRFVQRYFLVACSVLLAGCLFVRRSGAGKRDWRASEEGRLQPTIQHPTTMRGGVLRILPREAKLGWDEAQGSDEEERWRTTNHTLLPEARREMAGRVV